MDALIRPIEQNDLDQFINLCALHADFEKCAFDKTNKVQLLASAFFSTTPSLYGYVAEYNNNLVGYLSATKEFSTWDGAYFLHMDCLYLTENSRGLGLGSQFIDTAKDLAKKLQCTHIQWQTPLDNEPAIQFYQHIGAIFKDKKRCFLEL